MVTLKVTLMSDRIRRFSETIENIETVFANHHKNHKQNE